MGHPGGYQLPGQRPGSKVSAMWRGERARRRIGQTERRATVKRPSARKKRMLWPVRSSSVLGRADV